MKLSEIGIRDLRCVERARLTPGAGINLFVGANGSGKTSVLEAIALVTRGRSFRVHYGRPLVRSGGSALAVRASVSRGGVGMTRLRYAYASGKSRASIDGVRIRGLGQLASAVPVVVSEPEGQRGAVVNASVRREIIDWTLFHVEQAYLGTYRRYRRALDQRNQLLRNSPSATELKSWSGGLAVEGAAVESLRQRHLGEFLEAAGGFLAALCSRPLTVEYRRGWSEEESYDEALARAGTLDSRRGYTSVGPHRADLALRVDGQDARLVLSRGEAKLASLALHLGQAHVLGEHAAAAPLILLDDLAAELDADNLDRVLQALVALGCQTFATGVDEQGFQQIPGDRLSLFHVKQGGVSMVL